MLATLRLSWPLALANLLQMLTYAVDVIFIARLGEAQLAASALAVALFGGVAPAGKTLKFNVLGYYRFKEGKIIECRKHNVGQNHDFISAMGIREQLSA